MIRELAPQSLRRSFDPRLLECETTETVMPREGIIGQPRALEALAFGVEIDDPTFHVYVAGPPGTGRRTAVVEYLTQLASDGETPSDWCYVHNFADASRPKALRLEPGQGRMLADDLDRLIDRAREEVPKSLESEGYAARRREIERDLEEERGKLYARLKEAAGEDDFLVETGPVGVAVTPVIRGRPLTEDLARGVPSDAMEELEEKRKRVEEAVKQTLKAVRSAERLARQRIEELTREVVRFLVGGLVEDLVDKFPCNQGVRSYLEEVRDSLAAEPEILEKPEAGGAGFPISIPWMEEIPFRRYRVNVLVERNSKGGAPVVIELNPTYGNLFGRIEKESRLGTLTTDFTLLKSGALHEANGGYLVLPVRELLLDYLSYDSLKRALRNREVDIEEPSERLGLGTTRTLRPEPIPLDVKVVLIGTPLLYHLLYMLDEDFDELFKVKAHFDDRMGRDAEHVSDYVAFIAGLCQKEGLPHLDREAVALVIEQGSRLAADQEKLTTRFADVANLVREAAHTARRRNADAISGDDMRDSIETRIYRSNLSEERITEMIQRGQIVVDTVGEAVGQVNAVSLVDLGDYRFGRPTRITASVSLGQAGIIDIEREAKLGGPIHSKGVMILSGYLADRFARDYPLSLSAGLVFEQSYGGVEGDSASGAELLALLSALSGQPISQGVAITGSVDQHGRLQAVGAVNEKVEGFYRICRIKGHTGLQGMVIPASNVDQLMLDRDVVEASESGTFHVWAADLVEEAVEILFGMPAGSRGPDGEYPAGTLYRLVDDRLEHMAVLLSGFGQPVVWEGISQAGEGGPADTGDVGAAVSGRSRAGRWAGRQLPLRDHDQGGKVASGAKVESWHRVIDAVLRYLEKERPLPPHLVDDLHATLRAMEEAIQEGRDRRGPPTETDSG